MHSFWKMMAAGTLAFLLLAACDDGIHTETDDGALNGPTCMPGDTRQCACDPEAQGVQGCMEDGSGWKTCECGFSPDTENAVCLPGVLEDCLCPDGSEGIRECLMDGTGWTACECDPSGQDEPVWDPNEEEPLPDEEGPGGEEPAWDPNEEEPPPDEEGPGAGEPPGDPLVG